RKQYQEWKRQALQQRGQHDKNERYRKPQRETDLFFFFFGPDLLARLFSLVSIRELNSGQDILDELLTHLIGAEVFPVDMRRILLIFPRDRARYFARLDVDHMYQKHM